MEIRDVKANDEIVCFTRNGIVAGHVLRMDASAFYMSVPHCFLHVPVYHSCILSVMPLSGFCAGSRDLAEVYDEYGQSEGDTLLYAYEYFIEYLHRE